MTAPVSPVSPAHRRAAAEAQLTRVYPHQEMWEALEVWISKGAFDPACNWTFTIIQQAQFDAIAQAIAAEGAKRDAEIAELKARIAELEESEEMACQTPADHCDCPGCSLVAEKARTNG